MVLKGLELAARDAARGVLTPEQKNDIRDTVAVLIAGLDRRETEVPDDDFAIPDDIPEAWKQDGAVLCVTGRSFVDESACSILAQLLGKRGIGTRIVPFADVARAQIDSFDPGPARMICIVSLAISGEPTHLRRLVGRLKRRMPDLPIVVGLWQADHEILNDEGSARGDRRRRARLVPRFHIAGRPRPGRHDCGGRQGGLVRARATAIGPRHGRPGDLTEEALRCGRKAGRWRSNHRGHGGRSGPIGLDAAGPSSLPWRTRFGQEARR